MERKIRRNLLRAKIANIAQRRKPEKYRKELKFDPLADLTLEERQHVKRSILPKMKQRPVDMSAASPAARAVRRYVLHACGRLEDTLVESRASFCVAYKFNVTKDVALLKAAERVGEAESTEEGGEAKGGDAKDGEANGSEAKGSKPNLLYVLLIKLEVVAGVEDSQRVFFVPFMSEMPSGTVKFELEDDDVALRRIDEPVLGTVSKVIDMSRVHINDGAPFFENGIEL